jgi:hypothetical protein
VSATKGYRAAFQSHDGEQSYVTVCHFLAHIGGNDPSDLADALKTGAFPTALYKTLATGGQCDAVTVTQIMSHGDTTPPSQDTKVSTVAGGYSASGSDLPRDVCGLVRLHSNVSGRGTHGWIYGFPVQASSSILPSTGKLTSTYLTQLNAMSTALNSVLSVTTAGDTYDLAVFSRARWARGESSFLFSVKATVPDPKYHYLRKRGLAKT